MQTKHYILNCDSREISKKIDQKVNLIITSPPYPMIKMWDTLFKINSSNMDDDDILEDFKKSNNFLNEVWEESLKLLNDDGIVCINIGDATRNLGSQFRLFNNHSNIVNFFLDKGFVQLPGILWRKPTNSPNKFMGSGMLPTGAYVTLEHEYILIFRKKRRSFKSIEEKNNRMESAFFWEERNLWFNDVWEIRGTNQKNKVLNSRKRTAAYPFEIPYRLIKMFSIKDDWILDPFLGTGTTTFASILDQRNSIGVEIDPALYNNLISDVEINKDLLISRLNGQVSNRIKNHEDFLKNHEKEIKYYNENLKLKVKTKQETKIIFNEIKSIDIKKTNDKAIINVDYFIK